MAGVSATSRRRRPTANNRLEAVKRLQRGALALQTAENSSRRRFLEVLCHCAYYLF